MKYYVRTVIGLGMLAASLTAFCYSLYQLLGVGTCASGGAYVSARECPSGVGVLIVTLVVSVFAGLIGTGIWAARGNPPDDPDRPGGAAISSGIIAWSGLFLGSGLTCLYAVLGPDADPGPGAKTGAIIVAAIFIPMGAIPLIGALISGAGKIRKRRESSGLQSGGASSGWSAGSPTTAPVAPVAVTSTSDSTSSLSASVFGTQESTPTFGDGGSSGLGSPGIASVGPAPPSSSSGLPSVPTPTAPFGWSQGGAAAAASGTGSSSDPTARLEKLARLRASGVLTDAEFHAAKAKILGNL